MSVDLTKLPKPLLPLKKFSWWFWVTFLFALVITSCVIIFIVSFFYSLSDLLLILGGIVLPISLWIFSLLYGIYYRGYREEYIKQWNIYRDRRRQQLIDYARRGLYVLRSSLITEYGRSNNGNVIANGEYTVRSKRPNSGGNSIPHTALSLPNNISYNDFYERLKVIFLNWQLEYSIWFAKLSGRANIHVKIFIDTPTPLDNIEVLWLQTIGKVVKSTSFSVECVQKSSKYIEEWLDNSDYDDDLLLLINTHFFLSPSQNEAEEALLMLFAGEQAFKKLADVIDTEQVAKIYRSEQTGELTKTLDHALLWGQEDKKTYDGVWYSGVSNQQNIDIMKHFNDIEFESGGVFNIDTTIGNAKNSAYFFALALAVEYAQSTGNKQLIVVGEPDITASVVTTVAKK